MIITKLIGGLGNQMFQYATGRLLAYKNKAVLKLDLSAYDNQSGITQRQYELSPFNVQQNFSNQIDNKIICGPEKKGLLGKIFRKLPDSFYKSNYIKEKGHNFNSSILDLNNNVYLDGYWQSEKYFSDISDIIRSEFTLKNNSLDPSLLQEIINKNSVSLHIRRGDYVFNPVTNRFHGVCTLDYYKRAIDFIEERFEDLTFYIFSDDLNWCKENLKINHPTFFVEGNKNYEDLILMSHCKYNIIANSSFSWWGAWLNNNPGKIVIAPEQWFADKSVDTDDLIPESWIKI